MPSGRAGKIADLPAPVQELIGRARRAVMTTIDADACPHAVPVVFAVVGEEIVSPIDRKPKTGRKLARVRNLERDPRVTLLIDLWDEDWSKLAWVMVRGRGVVDANASLDLMHAVNLRYAQYRTNEVHDALIRIRPTSLLWWSYS